MRQSKITLRKLIESEIQSVLNEEIVEPSEQVLKQATAYFKDKTGINVSIPMLRGKSKRYNEIYYESDLEKEIRTSTMKALFSSLVLSIVVEELPNAIGGYQFDYSLTYSHPNGKSDKLHLGTIYYRNNIFSSKGFLP
jgi:translation elongation factor EF-G